MKKLSQVSDEWLRKMIILLRLENKAQEERQYVKKLDLQEQEQLSK